MTQKFNKDSLLDEAQNENLETEEMHSETEKHTRSYALPVKQAGMGTGRSKSFSVVGMGSNRSGIKASAITTTGTNNFSYTSA